jgi:hypothetical protein
MSSCVPLQQGPGALTCCLGPRGRRTPAGVVGQVRLRLSWMCADACAAPVTRPRRRRPPRPRQSLPSQVDRPMPASCSPPEYPSHPPGCPHLPPCPPFVEAPGVACASGVPAAVHRQWRRAPLQPRDRSLEVGPGLGINSEVFLGYPQPHKHHSKPKSKAGPYKLHPKFPKILFSPGRLRIYCSYTRLVDDRRNCTHGGTILSHWGAEPRGWGLFCGVGSFLYQ